MVERSKKEKERKKLVQAAKELEAKADPMVCPRNDCLKWGGEIGFV